MPPEPPRRKAPFLFRWSSGAAFVGLLGYLALMATGRWTVLGELACQFRFAFGFVALTTLVPFVLARHWKRVAFAFALAVWSSVPEGALRFLSAGVDPSQRASLVQFPAGHRVQPADPVHGATLRIVCANVLRSNTRHAEVFDAILAGDPDVIGLLELSPAWRDAALDRLDADYPFQAFGLNTTEWNVHTWGLALFSKTPLTAPRAIPIESAGRTFRPVVEARLTAPLEVTLQLAHPERPGRPYRFRARRATLEAIAASPIQGHRVVIGDLNSTSTSPLFQSLVSDASLRDSRVGFSRQPTWYFGHRLPGPWPVPLPSWARLGVAIDHALVSGRLAVLERRTLAIPGSDHRAVAVTLGER